MPTEKPKAPRTKYHVLQQTRSKTTASAQSGGVSSASPHAAFDLVAEDVVANGDQHAIRLYLEGLGEKVSADLAPASAAALFVAIPARSWRPTRAEVKHERRVVLG